MAEDSVQDLTLKVLEQTQKLYQSILSDLTLYSARCDARHVLIVRLQHQTINKTTNNNRLLTLSQTCGSSPNNR